MSPVTQILNPQTLNAITLNIASVVALIYAVNNAKEFKAKREDLKAKQEELKATQQMKARRLELELSEMEDKRNAETRQFKLEAEKARSQHTLELRKALQNNEITRETFIELTQENASNIKAIVNEAESKTPISTDASALANGAETSQTATEQSELVSIDKDLSLRVDKDSFKKNEKSLSLYADINDSDSADYSLMSSMGKQKVVPKEQYLIGMDAPKVEQAQNTPPEQVSTVVEPRKPFQPRSRGGLPFASASLSRIPIGIRQSSVYGKGKGEEMHLAVPPSKSLWELESSSSSSNDLYSSLLPFALLALSLIQQLLTKLNQIQKQINDLTV